MMLSAMQDTPLRLTLSRSDGHIFWLAAFGFSLCAMGGALEAGSEAPVIDR
jgi:hypothetical protein